MTNNTLRLSKELSDLECAYSLACKAIAQRQAEDTELHNSRFFMMTSENGEKNLQKTTGGYISRCYDLVDCDPDIPEFFYCDIDGKLYPVTLGKQERIDSDEESPFVYATTPLLVRNTLVVGYVMHTDH